MRAPQVSSIGRAHAAGLSFASGQSVDPAIARLAAEMGERWRSGECPGAEVFLNRHPELWDQPENAVQLIYEEICLRQEHGQEVATAEIIRRFPQWRAQLNVLLDFHQLMAGPSPVPPVFPAVGEALGDCRVLAELGRGAQGRVYLATQSSLADRPVVLKVTPCSGQEHISLARLQHTHIVPLYALQDDPVQGRRVLCMPYFGGATLAALLAALGPKPLDQRTGKDLVDALDQAQAGGKVAIPSEGPARRFLARASYVQAVCWIGAGLAEALQYAHQRGLVHLDLKPSNVLLAADGQPMLLDFHLAREALQPDGTVYEWLGGTPEYMSPEQRAALAAVRQGRGVPAAVDGRSDIYSLGLLLYEALAGRLPDGAGASPAPLCRYNGQVTVGLADLIDKCLARDPSKRYPDAGAVTADLRRYLTDQPLKGVANRSWAERWRKWRRRRPNALTVTALLLALLVAVLAGGAGALAYLDQRLGEARSALREGRKQLQEHHPVEAVRTLQHGQELVPWMSHGRDLAAQLEHELRVARRAVVAQELHTLTDQLRLLYGVEHLPPEQVRELDSGCRAIWNRRGLLVEQAAAELGPEMERRIGTDLLDLAILWTDLRGRPVAPGHARDALHVLDEAEALFGPSPVLDRQRRALAELLGLTDGGRAAAGRGGELAPRTAWEHYALGRFLFRRGEFTPADAAFGQAIDLRPQDFWPHFYHGMCAYRLGKYGEAVNAFTVCTALAPEVAECYHNRALAHTALGELDQAVKDYDRALQRKPTLAAASRNLGLLQERLRQPR